MHMTFPAAYLRKVKAVCCLRDCLFTDTDRQGGPWRLEKHSIGRLDGDTVLPAGKDH